MRRNRTDVPGRAGGRSHEPDPVHATAAEPRGIAVPGGGAPWHALTVALLGFFTVTLDALAVGVALPSISGELGTGITGLQWIVDSYTLMFASLLLLSGTVSDRFGARRVFGVGMMLFMAASAACAFAPTLEVLVAARMVQGAGAAVMTPASLSLIGEAYPDPLRRSRAIGVWAMGGAIASAAGPLLGGALTLISWRLIFFINLPVGLGALLLLVRVRPSPRRDTSFDWVGQALAMTGLIALVYGLIEAGEAGFATPQVVVALGLGVSALGGFLFAQTRASHPMVPLGMFRSRQAAVAVAVGFTFMVGFFGMIFLFSLYYQQELGMTALAAGLAFAPVTALTTFVPVLAGRVAARFGSWLPITVGQVVMAFGLVSLAIAAETAPVGVLIGLMVVVAFGAGSAMPAATAMLLNDVPSERIGIAAGVLNTSRQVGGALAIAAFGALVALQGFQDGLRTSLLTAGLLLIPTAVASLTLRRSPDEADPADAAAA